MLCLRGFFSVWRFHSSSLAKLPFTMPPPRRPGSVNSIADILRSLGMGPAAVRPVFPRADLDVQRSAAAAEHILRTHAHHAPEDSAPPFVAALHSYPQKTPLVAPFLGLLHASPVATPTSARFVRAVAAALPDALLAALASGNERAAQSLLSLLCALGPAGVVSLSSVAAFVAALASAAVQAKEDNPRSAAVIASVTLLAVVPALPDLLLCPEAETALLSAVPQLAHLSALCVPGSLREALLAQTPSFLIAPPSPSCAPLECFLHDIDANMEQSFMPPTAVPVGAAFPFVAADAPWTVAPSAPLVISASIAAIALTAVFSSQKPDPSHAALVCLSSAHWTVAETPGPPSAADLAGYCSVLVAVALSPPSPAAALAALTLGELLQAHEASRVAVIDALLTAASAADPPAAYSAALLTGRVLAAAPSLTLAAACLSPLPDSALPAVVAALGDYYPRSAIEVVPAFAPHLRSDSEPVVPPSVVAGVALASSTPAAEVLSSVLHDFSSAPHIAGPRLHAIVAAGVATPAEVADALVPLCSQPADFAPWAGLFHFLTATGLLPNNSWPEHVRVTVSQHLIIAAPAPAPLAPPQTAPVYLESEQGENW
jgi:hypothetical protein